MRNQVSRYHLKRSIKFKGSLSIKEDTCDRALVFEYLPLMLLPLLWTFVVFAIDGESDGKQSFQTMILMNFTDDLIDECRCRFVQNVKRICISVYIYIYKIYAGLDFFILFLTS